MNACSIWSSYSIFGFPGISSISDSHPPPPYNKRNPLSMTNVFCCCSLRNSRENKLSPLENLQNCVTPPVNSKVKHETSRNSTWVFLEYSWKLHFFCNWPLELPHALSSIPLEIPCPSLNFYWDIPFPSILT